MPPCGETDRCIDAHVDVCTDIQAGALLACADALKQKKKRLSNGVGAHAYYMSARASLLRSHACGTRAALWGHSSQLYIGSISASPTAGLLRRFVAYIVMAEIVMARYRRRRVYCVRLDAPALKVTASARAFQRRHITY